ncbi:2OG-Fe(II) oxygenase [Methylobacterium sp. A54F]
MLTDSSHGVPSSHQSQRSPFIDLDDCLNPEVSQDHVIEALARTFVTAEPFEHIVIDGLFDKGLLREIASAAPHVMHEIGKSVADDNVQVHRTKSFGKLSPAAKSYFYLVNSATFTNFLTRLTSVEDLIVDANLKGGGLHETRTGGHFKVHRDFEFHERTMLKNKLVVITYLNEDWQETYGGALELWSDKICCKKIYPVFGRTVIFMHGPRSLHGHPEPLNVPPGITRKSIASYYYVNPEAAFTRHTRTSSQFHGAHGAKSMGRLKSAVRQSTPPILWNLVRNWKKPS